MSIKLLNVIENYKGLPHQVKAVESLERLLGAFGLSDDAEWVKLWRTPTAPLTQQFTNTWDGIEAAAKAAGAKFPEVVAAQWALESAFGSILSGKNNFLASKVHLELLRLPGKTTVTDPSLFKLPLKTSLHLMTA